MINSGDLNFSFSGLKTAVLYAVRHATDAHGLLSDDFKRGLAYEFEQAVVQTLDAKLRRALDQTGAGTLIIGGGVSANHVIRTHITALGQEYGIPVYMPTRHISGDNALMIALAGALHEEERDTPLHATGTKKLGSIK